MPKKATSKKSPANPEAERLKAELAAFTTANADLQRQVENQQAGLKHQEDVIAELQEMLQTARDALRPIKEATDQWIGWPDDGSEICRPLTFGVLRKANVAATAIGAVPPEAPQRLRLTPSSSP